MNPFQGRPLGPTALSLTMLGFGGSSVGNLFRPVAEEDASGAVAAACGADIRYSDTDPLYGFKRERRTFTRWPTVLHGT